MTEDEMVRWHHQLNGHKFEQVERKWRTEEPGVLQSMGLQTVGHNLVTEQQYSIFSQISKKVQLREKVKGHSYYRIRLV